MLDQDWADLRISEIINKHVKVMWRAAHSSLPLRYKTCHFSDTSSDKCSWCPMQRQDTNHFLMTCDRSVNMWTMVYKWIKLVFDGWILTNTKKVLMPVVTGNRNMSKFLKVIHSWMVF